MVPRPTRLESAATAAARAEGECLSLRKQLHEARADSATSEAASATATAEAAAASETQRAEVIELRGKLSEAEEAARVAELARAEALAEARAASAAADAARADADARRAALSEVERKHERMAAKVSELAALERVCGGNHRETALRERIRELEAHARELEAQLHAAHVASREVRASNARARPAASAR